MKNKLVMKDFVLGICLGIAIVCIIVLMLTDRRLAGMEASLKNMDNFIETVSSGDALVSNTSAGQTPVVTKDYDTSVKEWELTLDDGSTRHFTTPEGYYSLTDQYIDSVNQYYGATIEEGTVVCVGNATEQFASSVLIDAIPFSSLRNTMSALYGDAFDESMIQSDAYKYMTTGVEPEEATIEELDSIGDYRVFHLTYTQVYEVEEGETMSQDVQELTAYSPDADTIEVIVSMQEFDLDKAVEILTEFLQ